MKLTRSKTIPEAERKELEREFAVSTWLQTTELLKRTFKQYWRDPSYLYGKLFVAVVVGIFNGFTFWCVLLTRTAGELASYVSEVLKDSRAIKTPSLFSVLDIC